MSQEYKKPCIYCKKEITMSDQASGKWLPYNSDGSVHDCRTSNKNGHVKQEDKPEQPRKPIEEVTAMVAIFNKLKEISDKIHGLVLLGVGKVK